MVKAQAYPRVKTLSREVFPHAPSPLLITEHKLAAQFHRGKVAVQKNEFSLNRLSATAERHDD